ncbi:MAG: TRAP transporter substrate-binding protein DctP [Deltaproteobacteria bacterium]|nr:TRAP transporter substrate-binding protein DctP [Deltaproteobacteria bacterium]
MSRVHDSEETLKRPTRRRDFLKSAATVTIGAVSVFGFPSVRKASASSSVHWKIQTVWDTDTSGFTKFQELCSMTTELSGGALVLEGVPSGGVVKAEEAFDACKAGVIDAMHGFDASWTKKMPVCTFLSAYPLGPDRPGQWETWYERMGGSEIANEAYSAHKMAHVGPIQCSGRVIFSKVPIRSFQDFNGKKIHFEKEMSRDLLKASGATPVDLAPSKVYEALQTGTIDATGSVSASAGYQMGLGEFAKYVILGPPGTPSIHDAAEIMSLCPNARKWETLSEPLRKVLGVAVKKHSWDQYATFQKADMEAFRRLREDQHVEVIRLSPQDMDLFRKQTPEIWVKHAKRSPLALKAFKSQLEFMKSPVVGLVSESNLTNAKGEPLTF